MEGLFLDHSLIIIKSTLGDFFEHSQFDPPLLQLGTKEYIATIRIRTTLLNVMDTKDSEMPNKAPTVGKE